MIKKTAVLPAIPSDIDKLPCCSHELHHGRAFFFHINEQAEVLGGSQQRISDIATGKISKFTVEALVSILAKAGIDV